VKERGKGKYTPNARLNRGYGYREGKGNSRQLEDGPVVVPSLKRERRQEWRPIKSPQKGMEKNEKLGAGFCTGELWRAYKRGDLRVLLS